MAGDDTNSGTAKPGHGEAPQRQLSALLVWAVVFCDIGTSVYYVPGILYSQIGRLTPLMVFATTAGFLLLASKYVEICWRNPHGGGVVSVATKAFGPRWGVFGGMLITVDYFLTSAISSVSGIHYLASFVPGLSDHAMAASLAAMVLLAAINVVGIRESAIFSLVMAFSAVVVDLVVVGTTLWHLGPAERSAVLDHLHLTGATTPRVLLTGFGSAWLAFSGLESISQLSAAMRTPLRTTAQRGMLLVVATVTMTAPALTLFSIALLPEAVKATESERFISELAHQTGGLPVELAVVVTASVLLLFAANTAIIGAYHVFLALANRGFLPNLIISRNRTFGTPHNAVLIATLVPILVVIFTQGDLTTLGELYAFGLLGAFVLSSAGIDTLRWRAGVRGPLLWGGLFTTAMVVLAWGVNLVIKHEATLFGSTLVGFGMILAVGTQQKWFTEFFFRFRFFARLAERTIFEAEHQTEDVPELIGLSEAKAIMPLYPSHTLVALRGPNPALVLEAITRERGKGGIAIYALYVEERPGLFVGQSSRKPDREGIETLATANEVALCEKFTLVPVWTISYNAAEAIARAATTLDVDTVMMGVSRRSAVYHLLRGHVINGLIRRLPPSCRLMLHS